MRKLYKVIFAAIGMTAILSTETIAKPKVKLKEVAPVYAVQSVQLGFPNAENIFWSNKGSKYQADFIYSNKNCSMLFNKRGELMIQKIEMKEGEVNADVLMELKEKYNNYKIISIMEDWKGKKHGYYEFHLQRGNEIKTVLVKKPSVSCVCGF